MCKTGLHPHLCKMGISTASLNTNKVRNVLCTPSDILSSILFMVFILSFTLKHFRYLIFSHLQTDQEYVPFKKAYYMESTVSIVNCVSIDNAGSEIFSACDVWVKDKPSLAATVLEALPLIRHSKPSLVSGRERKPANGTCLRHLVFTCTLLEQIFFFYFPVLLHTHYSYNIQHYFFSDAHGQCASLLF